MVRIGFVRWLIQAISRPLNGGKTEISLSLIPQAIRYQVLTKSGEQDVSAKTLAVSRIEDNYEIWRGKRLVEIVNELAAELAGDAIRYSTNIGLVDYEGQNVFLVHYIVKTAIIKAAERNVSDPIERVDFIDLAADMREIRAERERQAAERVARQAEARRQHNAEAAIRNERAEKSMQVSFDLLRGFLSDSEKAEMEKAGHVTVKTLCGDFVVPTTAHGLVKQYENGVYKVSHCVVFSDYSIPVGDEILMKIAFLKADPAMFLKTSVKFVEDGIHRNRV